MNTIQARQLLYRLLALMPTVHQRNALRALVLSFLTPTTSSLPEHNQLVSAASLSRFLNHYAWPTRKVVRLMRDTLTTSLLVSKKPGKRPTLRVLIDLTCLEKTGRFDKLADWLHVLNGKRGLHLVVLYLELGEMRVPCTRPTRAGLVPVLGASASGVAKVRRVPQPSPCDSSTPFPRCC